MDKALGKLVQIDLREVWDDEARDFTPWLAKEENIKLLGNTIGVELVFEAKEKNVGVFYADILCKNPINDSWVLIENQLEKTDHCHLGQIITYAAGLEAVTVIWIAKKFTEEHRAAIDWLNERTESNINFFGIEMELWKISNSEPAPKFNIVCQPNDWVKVVRSTTEARRWTEPMFMQTLSQNKGEDCVQVAQELLRWSETWCDRLWWGQGAKMGSFIPVINRDGIEYILFSVWTYGSVETGFQWLASKKPFDNEQMRMELQNRFNKIQGVRLPSDSINRRPSFKLELLKNADSMQTFKDACMWAIETIRQY